MTPGEFWLFIATLLLAMVALFGEKFWSCINQPKLKLEVGNCSPFSLAVPAVYTQSGLRIPNYECRIEVTNKGKSPAKNVEVFAEALRKMNDKGVFEKHLWLPMNLDWADIVTNKPVTFLPQIALHMQRYCALGHVLNPKCLKNAARVPALQGEIWDKGPLQCGTPVFSFHTVMQPNSKPYLVSPGVYELDVVAAAENAKPVRRTISTELRGWADDEASMLGKQLVVSMKEPPMRA